MDTSARFVGCDWGTSRLRLYLCSPRDAGPAVVLDARSGPGVGEIDDCFEATFFELADDWVSPRGSVPVIISGMAGSTIGWKDAPYLDCPLDVTGIADGGIAFEARGVPFSIVAGLRCTNPLGAPDVMRGEELQILGWMSTADPARASTHLIALPGTHNKWVRVRDGRIETFLTALTGELYALLDRYSVIVAARGTDQIDAGAFRRGIEAAGELGAASLLHGLFATRSRQVLGSLPEACASSYLSGLLVGSDVLGALAVFDDADEPPESIGLIGDAGLVDRYRIALAHLGRTARLNDAAEAAVAGYSAVYEQLRRRQSR